MTRHPVRLEQLPPDLRDGMPRRRRAAASTGRRASCARSSSASSSTRSSRCAQAGKLGGILFQLPPYVVPKPSSLDYLEWARDQLGGDRDARRVPPPRRGSRRASRAEVLRWLEERRMSYVTVDAPRLDAANVPRTVVAATTPLAYVRFHGRNAATWNTRGGGAAQRFDYLYGEDELREWVEPLRELAGAARAGLRVLQQQQPDRRRRPGPGGRARSCGSCSRRRTCRSPSATRVAVRDGVAFAHDPHPGWGPTPLPPSRPTLPANGSANANVRQSLHPDSVATAAAAPDSALRGYAGRDAGLRLESAGRFGDHSCHEPA